jgi:lysozyme family protein
VSASRRTLLTTATAGAAAILTTQASSQAIDASQNSSGLNRELQSLIARGQELGLAGPQAASAGPKNSLDVAELIDAALAKGADDANAASLARRTGLLLSEVNRNKLDGVDYVPSDATPASTKYVFNNDFKNEYATLYNRATVIAADVPELARAAKFISSASPKQRYKEVESDTGVPWYVVGALHYREASLNFMGHLHNGDPLLMQTVHVPENRPPKPWPPANVTDPRQLWRLSAKDALQPIAALTSKWTFQRTCFAFESYNGFGCRDHGIHSPYLWNYTNWYSRGGFPRDHYFDASYQSKQAGLVAVLIELVKIDGADVQIQLES